MTRNKISVKSILLCLGLMILGIVIVISAFFSYHEIRSYPAVIRANWDLNIPISSRYSLEYYSDSGPSFHGDGERFCVLSYKREAPIENMVKWADTEGQTRHNRSYIEAVSEWLDKIEVPKELRPDYDSCLYWYNTKSDSSEIIIFWDKEAQLLYVAERFL